MTVKPDTVAASVLTDLLFDEPGVGRCLVAPDGSIVRANAEWLRSTGFALDDVLGADIVELFPETRDMALAMHARARAGHRVAVPRHAQHVDGRETWWEGSIAPVPMGGGTGLLITAREVTGSALSAEPGHAVAPDGERLRTIANEAQFAVFAKAADGRYVFANRYVAELLGTTPERVVGRRLDDILPAEVALRIRERERPAAAGHVWTEDVVPTPAGDRTMLTARFPLRLPSGELGTCGIAFDITGQVEAREAAKRAEAVLSHAGAMTQLGAWWIEISNEDDLNSNPLRWSDETFRIFGYAPGEVHVTNDLFFQHVHPDDRKLVVDAVARSIASGERYSLEHRLVRRDGVERTVLERGEAQRDERGRLVQIVGAVQDVTERKRVEEELRQAVRRYERQGRLFEGVASTTPDFVYVFDPRGRFLYANRRLLDVWGVQLGDAVGKTCRELGYEQWHHDMHMREIAQVIATKQPIKGEVPFKAPLTGIFGVYEYIFTPVIGPDGEVETIAGTTRDVTDRKRAEEALRENQARLEHERARLQAIIDTIPVGFFLVEPGGKVVVTNDEAKRMWRGAASLEKIGDYDKYVGYWTETGERLKPEEWPAAQALLHARRTKGVMVDIERFDGTRGTILVSAAPIQDGAGHVTGAVVATQDVSELRAAHARLEEVDRRKTEFLAMLSHELRNPLAPIRNGIYLLERVAPESEQATRAREVVRRQAEHLTRLVDDLLDVTRISHGKIPLERSRWDLREIVRKTTDDLHSVFTQAGIKLRVDHVTAGPMWIEADSTRVSQVITNLLNNSMKFTPSGGTVRVSVAARDGRAELSVVDDGIGMDPKDIEHMFEPFAQADHSLARTKGGLGLGLALVKSIVELHGGTVAAHSEGVGRGAEFTVRLPLVDPGAESERPPRPGAGATPQTILVIEDNVDGAQSLADILEMHGHRVRVARDGRSGITLARELRPDVILCDIGLPDVDGYDVARTIRREGPLRETRLVALSGYAQPEDRQRARDAGFDAHLAKPVDLDELTTALAKHRWARRT